MQQQMLAASICFLESEHWEVIVVTLQDDGRLGINICANALVAAALCEGRADACAVIHQPGPVYRLFRLPSEAAAYCRELVVELQEELHP